MKVSEKTVSSYIDHLIDDYVLAKSERYDIKGKRHINSPYKYYFTDIGQNIAGVFTTAIDNSLANFIRY